MNCDSKKRRKCSYASFCWKFAEIWYPEMTLHLNEQSANFVDIYAGHLWEEAFLERSRANCLCFGSFKPGLVHWTMLMNWLNNHGSASSPMALCNGSLAGPTPEIILISIGTVAASHHDPWSIIVRCILEADLSATGGSCYLKVNCHKGAWSFLLLNILLTSACQGIIKNEKWLGRWTRALDHLKVQLTFFEVGIFCLFKMLRQDKQDSSERTVHQNKLFGRQYFKYFGDGSYTVWITGTEINLLISMAPFWWRRFFLSLSRIWSWWTYFCGEPTCL